MDTLFLILVHFFLQYNKIDYLNELEKKIEKIYMMLTTAFLLERRWNFMVSLQHVQYDANGRQTFHNICAGSIISSNLVITAGHCAVSQSDIGFTINYNEENGVWDGLIVLSNSVYSEVGKSVDEERHQIEKIKLALETAGKP